MKNLDYTILILYFLIVAIIGIAVNKNTSHKERISGGRSSGWLLVGLSILATQISTVTFIGAPGWSYASGMNVLVLYISIPIVMFICSTIFVPFFYNLGIYSIYDYISTRFSKNTSIIVAISYLLNTAIILGGLVLAPSIIINSVTGLNIILCIVIIVLITSFYTIVGGIKAVMITDFIQMILFWLGMFFVFFFLLSQIPEPITEILSIAKSHGKLKVFDLDMSLLSENTFLAGFLGFVVYNVAYYGCEQTQVQRMLTSKSIKDLKISLWFSGVATVIQMTIFIFIGIMFFVYYDGREFSSQNDIFITYIKSNVPTGILGLLISVLFAGSMSSIDSALNSMSVVTVKHILPNFIKEIDDKKNILLYKFSIIFWTIITFIFTLFYYKNMGETSILEALSKYSSYILGGLFGVFILGMFIKKANARGAIFGLIFSVISLAIILNIVPLFWVWNVLVGASICVISGYIVSILSSKEENTYTLMEQRKEMIASGNIKEGSFYKIPFKIDKYEFIPLSIMLIICIILWFM